MLNKKLEIKEIKTSFTYLIIPSLLTKILVKKWKIITINCS